MIIMGQWTRVENNNEVFLRVTNHTGQAEKNLLGPAGIRTRDLRSNLSKCYMLLSFVPDMLRDFYGNFIPYTTRPEFNHQKKYHTKFVNNVWEQRCNNDAWFHQAATSCCHCLVAICCANETFKQFSDLRNRDL